MSKSSASLWQRLKRLFRDDSNADLTPSPVNQGALLPSPNTPPSDSLANLNTVDLTERTHALPTADDVAMALQALGYQFTHYPPTASDELTEQGSEYEHEHDNGQASGQGVHHFTMQVSDREHEWGCLMRYYSGQQLMAVYSILPFSVPESHRADMLTIMTYLNYDLMIGNLELDLHDGEVRFKTSLDLEVTGASEYAISYLLQSNFSLISRLYETLEDVVKKSKPAHDVQQALDDFIASQQAKTFYLMTEAVQ